MPSKNQHKHAKRANCESSNPQEQQHDSDEDVRTPGKEIATKYIRARGKPDRYYQKKMDNFFTKYPEEEEKMADEVPELYSWIKKIPVQVHEDSSQPELDVSFYVESDDHVIFSTDNDNDDGSNSSKKAEEVQKPPHDWRENTTVVSSSTLTINEKKHRSIKTQQGLTGPKVKEESNLLLL